MVKMSPSSFPVVELMKNGWWETHAVQVVTEAEASWIDVVISSEIPVVVEFWAAGSVPCQMIAPIFIDDLA